MMTKKAGDDDLFVNHLATKQNTAVVLCRDSLTWSPAKKTFKQWWQQKRRHLSVSPAYRPLSKFRLTIEPITRGLFYILLIVIGIQYPVLGIPFATAAGLFLIRWVMQTVILNVSARRLGLPRFNPFTILWLDITLPLVNLWILSFPKKQTKW